MAIKIGEENFKDEIKIVNNTDWEKEEIEMFGKVAPKFLLIIEKDDFARMLILKNSTRDLIILKNYFKLKIYFSQLCEKNCNGKCLRNGSMN